MGRHKLRLEIEFDIQDEVGLTAESDLLQAGVIAPEYSGFENALAHKAIIVAQAAWANAGMPVIGVGVLK